jgi:hypothetical protein
LAPPPVHQYATQTADYHRQPFQDAPLSNHHHEQQPINNPQTLHFYHQPPVQQQNLQASNYHQEQTHHARASDFYGQQAHAQSSNYHHEHTQPVDTSNYYQSSSGHQIVDITNDEEIAQGNNDQYYQSGTARRLETQGGQYHGNDCSAYLTGRPAAMTTAQLQNPQSHGANAGLFVTGRDNVEAPQRRSTNQAEADAASFLASLSKGQQ